MKLSEAIRKGSKGQKQITGRFFDDGAGCCALGAALIGACGSREQARKAIRSEMWIVSCLTKRGVPFENSPNISVLNDDMRMTFEEIASHLESIGQ